MPTYKSWLNFYCKSFFTVQASLIFAAASLKAAPTSEAPTPLPSYPAGVSMPWRPIGIEAEARGTAHEALISSAKMLASAWLSTPQTLTAFLGTQHPSSRNNRLITDRVLTGKPTDGGPSRLVEPSWCAVMDRYLFFVTVADTERNSLLASAHSSIRREAWNKLGGKGQKAYLEQHMPALLRTALAAAHPSSDQDALHVGLTVGRETTRGDEGSSLCLNQILEEQLAAKYTVTRELGADHQALMSDLLGRRVTLRRPTRTLALNWMHQPEVDFNRTLPVKFTVSANVIETVFGKHLPVAYKADWTCQEAAAGGDTTVTCKGDESLDKLLTAERNTLLLSDWPQVAKRDRAWVYLDRGRAWGLKMNDRMIAEVDGQPVKGHVVHFFGPEEGLKSPRGFPIEEGAILYIRLNQRLPKVGTTFKDDPRTFPYPQ